MPYRYFNIELHHLEQLFDLSFPINLFERYVTELGDRISGHNFNKYYQPPSNPHPTLSLRFNVIKPVEQTILDLSQRLRESGDIRYYDSELHDWSEPDFVVRAHEIGTLSAIELKNGIEASSDLMGKLQSKPVEFTVYFVSEMLRSIGFDVKILWSLLRLSPVREDEIAAITHSCAEIFNRNIGEIEVTPSFMERFIHAFFNCTFSRAESAFRSWLNESQFWKGIVDSYEGNESEQ